MSYVELELVYQAQTPPPRYPNKPDEQQLLQHVGSQLLLQVGSQLVRQQLSPKIQKALAGCSNIRTVPRTIDNVSKVFIIASIRVYKIGRNLPKSTISY